MATEMYVGDKFIGTKIINACPCDAWKKMGEYEVGSPGYKVTYSDGYQSWSPKEIFEESYRQISDMTFGLAIEAMRKGMKVARSGWNGKGMWLCYMPPFVVEEPNERTREHGITESFQCGGYIVMWTAQGVWQPGWLASQTDMLADDWMVL